MAQETMNLGLLRDHLRRSRNFDCEKWNQSELEVTTLRRMAALKVRTIADYVDQLEVDPQEYRHFFDDLFGAMSTYKNDEPCWSFLKKDVLLNLKGDSKSPLRIWSIGCATGPEAYLIAGILSDHIGDELSENIKVFATDVDEQALAHARQGTYAANELEDMPQEWRINYFKPSGANFVVRQDLRKAVIFGRHDILQDPPITRMDMIICRYCLVYYDNETQHQIVSRMQFALKPGGYLFLGNSEIMPHNGEFSQPAPDCKVYVKENGTSPQVRGDGREFNGNLTAKLLDLTLDSSHIATVVINGSGLLVLANAKARSTLSLGRPDIGKELKDLELSYRPVELRSLIERAHEEHRTVTAEKVARHLPSGIQFFDVHVRPISGTTHGAVIQFQDMTDYANLQEDLTSLNQQLQTANEELQSSHEELETTNEELQSTNEELETTNEELQSTNEELETINEELQSINTALEATNAEQRFLSRTIHETNSFLEAILSSMNSAVAVLNEKHEVVLWNQASTELWGLRADEVKGQSFFSLDIGLPVSELLNPIKQVVTKEKSYEERSVKAINRRGRTIHCRVLMTPLEEHSGARHGAVLLFCDIDGTSENG
jgi:two-component system, chemotaxis family, CheB/CheR fusion protein